MKRTIRDVLQDSAHANCFAFGKDAEVKDFPADLRDLKPYVIRQSHNFDPYWLGATSSLVPPKMLINRMHVGQPLLQLGGKTGFSILPRQHGLSIVQWLARYSEHLSTLQVNGLENNYQTRAALYTKITEFDHARGNPFIPIFEQTYQLGQLGSIPDSGLSNVFIDTDAQCLRLVDQIDYRRLGSIKGSGTDSMTCMRHGLGQYLLVPKRWQSQLNPEQDTRMKIQQSELRQMMVEAEEMVLAFHHSDIGRPKAFVRTDSIQGVALNAPPHHLVEKLRQLEKLAEIPQR